MNFTLVLSLSDSGCTGKVCEEGNRALQGRLGSSEPDGFHPERGVPAPPLRDSTFDNHTTYRTTVFTACRMGTVIPGRPLWPWAPVPSVILASAREFSSPHASARFLCTVGPHVRYRAPICMAWHACEPGFSHGRSPCWQDVSRGKSRAMFLLLNINLSRVLSSQFKCCGWNNYTDWSWNLYFNCTLENPSYERCAVPHSCCIPIPGEVCEIFCSLPKTDRDIVCLTIQKTWIGFSHQEKKTSVRC